MIAVWDGRVLTARSNSARKRKQTHFEVKPVSAGVNQFIICSNKVMIDVCPTRDQQTYFASPLK